MAKAKMTNPKKLSSTFDLLFCTVFCVGKLPKMPGTYGSMVALLFLLIPMHLRLYILAPLFVIFFVVSLFSIKRMESEFGDDPGMVVIDEVLGMMLIFMLPFVVYDWVFGILAFLFFRLFDIVKPFPINILNDKKGSFFVIVDDLIAAIFAWIVLVVLYKLASYLGFAFVLSEVIK